eukprot:TRINITY_DN10601_c1_g1_i2.p1 TRINITY_DN10601_c1_g1~~TRINITY_DN10601_c1_g1_i2.p1  ORF type:complete len:668 (+),score=247.81 TRINITY_DN10601_c1_g1_i2:107-2110(+)
MDPLATALLCDKPPEPPILKSEMRQERHNAALRAAVEKQEERIQSVLPLFLSYGEPGLREMFARARDLYAVYETGLSWNLSGQTDVREIGRVCGLELSAAHIGKSEQNLVPCAALRQQCADMVSRCDDMTARGQYVPLKVRDAVAFTSAQLVRVEQELADSSADTEGMSALSLESLNLCQAVLHAPLVTDLLSEHTRETACMVQELKALHSAQSHLEWDGEVAVSVDAMEEVVSATSGLLRLAEEKTAVVVSAARANGRFSNAWDVLRRANQKSWAMKDRLRGLRQRCFHDLSLLHAEMERRDSADAEAVAGHRRFRESSEEELADLEALLVKQWHLLWSGRYTEQKDSLLAEHVRLGRRRVELVLERVRRHSDNERRKERHKGFLTVAHAHKKRLELCAADCRASVAAVGKIEQAIRAQCTAAHGRYRTVRRELEQLRCKGLEEQLSYTRRGFLLLSMSQHRRLLEAASLADAGDAAEMRREMCSETFDPQSKGFSLKRENLLPRARHALDAAAELGDRAAKLEAVAQPLFKALSAAGIQYLHPRDELEQVVKERAAQRTAMIGYLNRSAECRIAAEREQIRRIVEWRAVRGLGGGGGYADGRLPPCAQASSPTKLPRYPPATGAEDTTGLPAAPDTPDIDPTSLDLWSSCGAVHRHPSPVPCDID